MSFKTIRIKKRGGGTREQRVKVLASGKYKFVKNVKKSYSPRISSKKTRRKGVKIMARRKRRSGGKPLMPKIFKWIRVGALVAPGIAAAKHGLDSGWGIDGALDQTLQAYTGYSWINNTFDFGQLARGWTPYLMSVIATVGIPKISSILRRL